MKLFANRHGSSGVNLIIIHGLFGMSDNWSTLGKRFGVDFKVHLLDLRNHGKSPHSDDFNFDVMCEDLLEYMLDNNINKSILIGHSLGGKVVMKFAFTYPEKIKMAFVVDISPRRYSIDFFQDVLQKLNELKIQNYSKREDIDNLLSTPFKDKSMRYFLLKNLYRKKNKKFAWRFNIEVLLKKIINIQGVDFVQGVCEIPTHFIRGENSNYITREDKIIINKHFSKSNVESIKNAGHWLHADQPKEFYKIVTEIINKE